MFSGDGEQSVPNWLTTFKSSCVCPLRGLINKHEGKWLNDPTESSTPAHTQLTKTAGAIHGEVFPRSGEESLFDLS